MSGPSPLIPSLIVGLLIAATCGPRLLHSSSFLSEVEETTVSFVFIIPLLCLLMIYFVSESIIIPLVLLLVIHFVSRMVMGPLILVLIIHVLSSWFPSYQGKAAPSASSSSGGLGYGGEQACNSGSEGTTGYGWGWGSFWLLLVFLVLLKMFSGSDD